MDCVGKSVKPRYGGVVGKSWGGRGVVVGKCGWDFGCAWGCGEVGDFSARLIVYMGGYYEVFHIVMHWQLPEYW